MFDSKHATHIWDKNRPYNGFLRRQCHFNLTIGFFFHLLSVGGYAGTTSDIWNGAGGVQRFSIISAILATVFSFWVMLNMSWETAGNPARAVFVSLAFVFQLCYMAAWIGNPVDMANETIDASQWRFGFGWAACGNFLGAAITSIIDAVKEKKLNTQTN